MTMEAAFSRRNAFVGPRTTSDDGSGLRITDTARLLGTTTRALRYYEGQRLVRPGRTSGGARLYGGATRQRLQLVLTFRRLGVPVAAIRQAFERQPAELTEILRQRLIHLENERQLLLKTLSTLSTEFSLCEDVPGKGLERCWADKITPGVG